MTTESLKPMSISITTTYMLVGNTFMFDLLISQQGSASCRFAMFEFVEKNRNFDCNPIIHIVLNMRTL